MYRTRVKYKVWDADTVNIGRESRAIDFREFESPRVCERYRIHRVTRVTYKQEVIVVVVAMGNP